jgi:hypothetical protein
VFGIVFLQSFFHYYLNKNYPVFSLTSCDPHVDSCFIANEGSANFPFAEKPYRKVEVVAKNAPLCLDEHTCTDFTCGAGDSSCIITTCNSDSLEEGGHCVEQEK